MGSEGNKGNRWGIDARPQTSGGSEVFAKTDSASSQAGRRRFDPGRPLHKFGSYREQLEAQSESSTENCARPSPIHHPKPAVSGGPSRDLLALAFAYRGSKSWFAFLAASRASRLPRRGFHKLFDTFETEVLFTRVRRCKESDARLWFAFAINPERFAEPQKVNAGALAGNIEGGASTSGLEPCRATICSRGDEATGVGGTAWRSPRIVSASAGSKAEATE